MFQNFKETTIQKLYENSEEILGELSDFVEILCKY